MSDSDKDTIIGRAVREDRELRRDLAAAEKQLRDIGDALQNVRDQVSSRSPIVDSASKLTIPSDLRQYLDFSAISDLVSERSDLRTKLRESEKLLSDLGVRP